MSAFDQAKVDQAAAVINRRTQELESVKPYAQQAGQEPDELLDAVKAKGTYDAALLATGSLEGAVALQSQFKPEAVNRALTFLSEMPRSQENYRVIAGRLSMIEDQETKAVAVDLFNKREQSPKTFALAFSDPKYLAAARDVIPVAAEIEATITENYGSVIDRATYGLREQAKQMLIRTPLAAADAMNDLLSVRNKDGVLVPFPLTNELKKYVNKNIDYSQGLPGPELRSGTAGFISENFAKVVPILTHMAFALGSGFPLTALGTPEALEKYEYRKNILGMDVNENLALSTVEGISMALLEKLQLDELALFTTGVKTTGQLAKGGFIGALARAGTGFLRTTAAETGVEIAQAVTGAEFDLAAKSFVKELTTGDFWDAQSDAWKGSVEAATVMPFVTGMGLVGRVSHEFYRYNSAVRQQQAYATVEKLTENMDFSESRSAVNKDLLQRALDASPIAHIYTRTKDMLNAFLQADGTTPEEARKQLEATLVDLGFSSEERIAAELNGTDLEIPTAAWMQHFANADPKVTKALREAITFDIDSNYSLNDLKEVNEVLNTLTDDYILAANMTLQERTIPAEVVTAMASLVESGRMTKAEAAVNQSLLMAISSVAAKRRQMDIAEWWKTKGFTLEAGGTPGEIGADPFTQVDATTPEFKNWFGESKVVDKNGEPLVVYHGTRGDFRKFDIDQAAQGVFWFSSDKAKIESGTSGANSSKVIMPVYLSAKNLAGWGEYEKYSLQQIREMGFDGIQLDDDYVIFEPTQIKSVNNRGTFDPNDPNILKQREGVVRGAFNPATKVIEIFNTSNKSTFAHEIMHFFVEDLRDLVNNTELADEQVKNDYLGMVEYAGDLESADIEVRRAAHEKLADSFLVYLETGKAPSVKLQGIFNTFKEWLKNLFISARKQLNLSPEIEAIFGRMLASDQQIEEAGDYYRGTGEMLTLLEREATSVEETRAARAAQKSSIDRAKEALLAIRVRAWKEAQGGEEWFLEAAKEKALRIEPAYKLLDFFTGEDRALAYDEVSKELREKLKAAHGRGMVTQKGTMTLADLEQKAAELGFDSSVAALEYLSGLSKFSEAVKAQKKTVEADILASETAKYDAKRDAIIPNKTVIRDRATKIVESGSVETTLTALRESGQTINPNWFSPRINAGIAKHGADLLSIQSDMDIEAFARMQGFESGDQMVSVIAAEKPKEEAIQAEMQRIQTDEEIAILRDEAVISDVEWDESLSREVLNNSERVEHMIYTLLAIAKKVAGLKANKTLDKSGKGRVNIAAMKAAVEMRFKAMTIKEAANARGFSSAQQKYIKQALKQMRAGDFEGSLESQKLATINAMYMKHAVEFRKMAKKLTDFSKQTKLNKVLEATRDGKAIVNEEHANAVREIVATQNLNQTLKFKEGSIEALISLDKKLNGTAGAVIENMVYPSLERVIPLFVQQKTPAGTVAELEAVDATIRHLIDQGKGLMKFESEEIQGIMAAFGTTTDEQIENLVASLEAAGREDVKEGSRSDDLLKIAGKLFADLRRFVFIAEEADDFALSRTGKLGPMGTISSALSAAEGVFSDIKMDIDKKTDANLKTLRKAGERLRKKYGRNLERFPVKTTKYMREFGDTVWKPEELVVVLLNMGNKDNRAMLTDSQLGLGIDAPKVGHGMSDAELQRIAAEFTAEELAAIQGILDSIESLYPRMNDVVKRLTGREMVRVEGDGYEVTSADGKTVNLSGFYPIVHSARFSKVKGKQLEIEMSANSTNNLHRANHVRSGTTIERLRTLNLDTNEFEIAVVRPISFNIHSLKRHITDSARYISHADLMKSLQTILRDEKVQTAFRRKMGEAAWAQVVGAMNHVSRPEQVMQEASEPTAIVIRSLRRLATADILGFNPVTAAKQALSAFNAISELNQNGTGGARFMVESLSFLGTSLANPGRSVIDEIARIDAASSAMRNRGMTSQQNVNDLKIGYLDKILGTFTINGKTYTSQDAADAAFALIKYVDYATTYTVWRAAEQQALEQNLFGITSNMTEAQKGKLAAQYADRVVETTQPTSRPIDLAQVQRSEYWKLLTGFMTFTLGIQGNRVMSTFGKLKSGNSSPREVMIAFATEILTPRLIQLLVPLMLYADDDDQPSVSDFVLMPIEDTLMAWLPVGREFPSAVRFARGKEVHAGSIPMLSSLLGKTGNVLLTASKGDVEGFLGNLYYLGEYATGVPVSNLFEGPIKVWNKIEGDKK